LEIPSRWAPENDNPNAQQTPEYTKDKLTKSLEIPSRWAPENDNPNTQQTPEYTKDKYNVKIIK
jgi:hypothetical protein